MIKNNVKIAVRSLFKQKVYTFINVLGLAVGIASCILIVLFIQNEFSYDRFFKDQDRIYRMSLERIYPNHSTYYAIIPHSFAGVAKETFAEIEEATISSRFPNVELTYKNPRDEEVKFDEEMIISGDSSFFKIFDFEIIKGNSENLFRKGNEIVVTEELSKRYFGGEDPLGKLIRIGENLEFTVAAVIADIPLNSHFKFSAIVSNTGFPFLQQENFTGFSAFTYFKLREGTDPAVLEAKIPQLVDKYAAGQIERELGKSWEEYRNAGNGYRYFLQPLNAIHLFPTYLEAQMKPSGNINSVYILIAVAFLILGIACVNFMNLATARSSERAKEVGIRKVMGSLRPQLMRQFLTEAILLSGVGVFLALVIAQFAIPFFNDLTERNLQLPFSFGFALSILGIILFVGLLAGLYPALVLSSFKPTEVMKGQFTGSQKGKWIRNGLVVFQFWISIILIIGTLVIRDQMAYMQHISLGFDKEHVLVVERGFSFGPQNLKTFVEELRNMPEVENAAIAFASPGQESTFFGIQFQPEGSSEILTTKSMVVADGVSETLGLEILEGKGFSEDTNDSLYVLLNETAVKVMGIEDPIGSKLMETQNTPEGNVIVAHTVIGVVKDFNFISLRDEITPLVLQNTESFGTNIGGQYVFARIKPNQTQAAIEAIEAKWKAIAPAQAFKFSFLDESLDQQYREEQQTGRIFSIFSVLAIFVSCIGLFALSAYITSLRTKEIGVRKVLGASVGGVVMMLSKDFTKMVLIAFALAVPVAWWVMEKWWLQNFAFRINVNLWIILISGISVLAIAWLTVSFQSVKAALANPVDSLKSN
ncbi:ABC transporter permease [Aquiflexum gelatinilyticum]|uniref:ABC transporter permease n=1 Tax=Aquiflexum gelatinilyticum TaxID=2961943 RepID=A0A9X2P7W3_9BACT|nr:ABC transporter permease [Aquiflexum gelatinilyticum]MCR9015345.1 ABC transporter permease [Aquiflexum gelatinilyticum]